jgi:hypothetical protein
LEKLMAIRRFVPSASVSACRVRPKRCFQRLQAKHVKPACLAGQKIPHGRRHAAFKPSLMVFLAARPVRNANMKRAQAVQRLGREIAESGMNIASMAQQSYVGATQQSAAMSAVSPDSFGLDSSDDASDAAPASSTSSSGTATNATLSSQTLQALMDLLQGDPADSSSAAQQPKHHHHHGGGQPPTAASTASTDTSSTASANMAAADSGAEADDSESATLATALGA